MGLTGALMAVAPGLLAACIAAARFQYVSSESSLLAFVDTLIQAEEAEAAQGRQSGSDAASVLKRKPCGQYAVATEHNRKVRQRRDQLRTYAGLCITASVMTTLLLVAVVVAHYSV
jgi:hypothetical protein